MRYLFATPGAESRVMHISRHDSYGHELMQPLCHVRLPFNRTINAPFGLGRPVCRRCLRAAQEDA
jgi:hypothetical protein